MIKVRMQSDTEEPSFPFRYWVWNFNSFFDSIFDM